MNYSGILFDLDGTLVNTLDDVADAMNRVLESRGFPLHSVQSYRDRIGWGSRVLVEKALPAEHGDNGFEDENLVEACLAEFLADYAAHPVVKARLYPGIPELLDELEHKGVPKLILSNKTEPIVHQVVDACLDGWTFLKAWGNVDWRPRKPDPQGVIDICSQVDLDPKDILYIGDSEIDMETAVRAGCLPVGVLWGFRDREELVASGAKILAEHPSDILNIFQ